MKKAVLHILVLIFLNSHAKITFLTDIVYFEYSGNENFKSGTYESITFNNGKGANKLSFFISEQITNGKKELSKIYDLNFHETWIDSVYYSDPDTIFVNPFYDSTYALQDTAKFDMRDVFQDEIFLSFEHRFSDKYAANLEFKYTHFENSSFKSAFMIGKSHKFSYRNFSFDSNLSFSGIDYTVTEEIEKIIIDTLHYTTLDDTTYSFEPDSIVTTVIEEYNVFEEVTSDRNLNTIQFSQNFSCLYKNLFLESGIDIYKILNANEIDDKLNFFCHLDVSFYLDYFGFFGGFSKGEKYLLQTHDNKFLNVNKGFDFSYALGMIVYPFLRNWSISYQYKKNYCDSLQVDSHLLNFYFKLK